jgi:hypothetical protein
MKDLDRYLGIGMEVTLRAGTMGIVKDINAEKRSLTLGCSRVVSFTEVEEIFKPKALIWRRK